MLSRLNVLFLVVNLFSLNNNHKFILSTSRMDEESIYLSIFSNEELLCQINENKYLIDSKIIEINKNIIKKNDVHIVFYTKDYKRTYKYKLSFLGDYKVDAINKTNYYVGYHLFGLTNNSIAYNSFSRKISFYFNNNDEVNFKDPFDFSFSFLPYIYCKDENCLLSEFILFCNNQDIINENYNFYNYKIKLEIINKEEYFSLNNDSFNLPFNYNYNIFYGILYIYYFDAIFTINYKFNIEYLINDFSNYISFTETEEGVNEKENILHS